MSDPIDEALEIVKAHMQELYEDAAADIQEGGNPESLRLPQALMDVVSTLERQRVPEERKLVSVEPTDEMLNAATRVVQVESGGVKRRTLREIYRAMLAAAPEPNQ